MRPPNVVYLVAELLYPPRWPEVKMLWKNVAATESSKTNLSRKDMRDILTKWHFILLMNLVAVLLLSFTSFY